MSTLLPHLQSPCWAAAPSLLFDNNLYFTSFFFLLFQRLQVRAVVPNWRRSYLSPTPHPYGGHLAMSTDIVGCHKQRWRRRGYEHEVGRGRAAAKHPIMLRMGPPPPTVQDNSVEVGVE